MWEKRPDKKTQICVLTKSRYNFLAKKNNTKILFLFSTQYSLSLCVSLSLLFLLSPLSAHSHPPSLLYSLSISELNHLLSSFLMPPAHMHYYLRFFLSFHSFKSLSKFSFWYKFCSKFRTLHFIATIRDCDLSISRLSFFKRSTVQFNSYLFAIQTEFKAIVKHTKTC